MNYSSVQAILDAGVANAIQRRNNSKNDDGTDQWPGPSWFTFNGVPCGTIYASGNTWHGFGANAEQLRVNRRDTALWNWWSEEGTLYDYYRFFKFRWDGYSYYSTTSDAYRLTYDVILFETGDILLSMVKIPTSNYDGTFYLGSTAFTKPTVGNPYVSFYVQEDGSYRAEAALIDIPEPYARKWLLESGGTYYTIQDGALQALGIASVDADTFLEYGFDGTPPENALKTLPSPKLLYWFDSETDVPRLRASVTATPTPGSIEFCADVSNRIFTGIGSMTADVAGSVGVSCSVDDKATWSEEVSVADFLAMDRAALWEQLAGTRRLWLRFILHTPEDVLSEFIIACQG